jgi:hypothetical protein
MKSIILFIFIILVPVSIFAQDGAQYASFGGTILIDSANTAIIHHVRSNVFDISRFITGFSPSPAQWQALQDKAAQEADKQLKAMGYAHPIDHVILLSNYASQQKAQDGLDIWDARTPVDIKVTF